MPDATEAAGTAAPHALGRPRFLAQLPHDCPVTRPAVFSHRVAPAGRPGRRRPVRPAGQHAAQTGGELWLHSFIRDRRSTLKASLVYASCGTHQRETLCGWMLDVGGWNLEQEMFFFAILKRTDLLNFFSASFPRCGPDSKQLNLTDVLIGPITVPDVDVTMST